MAGATGLEPATSGVTGRRSNQLSYAPERVGATIMAPAQRRSPHGQDSWLARQANGTVLFHAVRRRRAAA